MGADDDYDAAAALVEFHASRAGVRGLIESGVASVPPLFLAPSSPSPPPLETVFFHVTNHGVHAGAVGSALSAVRAFHELPLAIRSAFYSLAPVGSVAYSTIPIQPGENTASPLLPWRDTLRVRFGPPAPDLGQLPAACRNALLQYKLFLAEFGKMMAGLLSEALGVGAELLERAMQVEGWLMACHYYPPCLEPARVMGSLEHTDPSLFTVLAQDGVGGLQVRLNGGHDHGGWTDVQPVPGALLVNIGDVLKVVSNDEYKSVEHRVRITSSRDARVSIALFFNPEARRLRLAWASPGARDSRTAGTVSEFHRDRVHEFSKRPRSWQVVNRSIQDCR